MTDSLHTELADLVERLQADLGSGLVTVCLFGSQVDRGSVRTGMSILTES